MVVPIRSTFSLDELHPRKTVLAPRSCVERTRWLRYEPWWLDAMTGSTISCLGSMPLICHEAVATEEVLSFIEVAGLERPRSLVRYRTESEAVAIARDCVAAGARLAYFYPPPPGADAAEMLLVPVDSYGTLNNKARLGEFVDVRRAPRRRVVAVDEIAGLLEQPPPAYPVFLKAAVEGGNGGGKDVRYCASFPDWNSAITWFLGERIYLTGLIVEDAIPFVATWCLSFAVLPDRSLYLGAAEQLFSSIGVQSGSRIDPVNAPPAEAVEVGLEIADRARARGYLGMCGFDIGVDRAGRVLVFDLNFRLNASTVQVLTHEAAAGRSGNRVSQSFESPVAGPLSAALTFLRPFVEQGRVVPLRIFDGAFSRHLSGSSFISGMVLAGDAERAEALEREVCGALGEPVS